MLSLGGLWENWKGPTSVGWIHTLAIIAIGATVAWASQRLLIDLPAQVRDSLRES